MWNNFHNLRHAVSKCIKQCKQRTKTLGNIWGIMGLYGRVWESQAKQKKQKHLYKFERVWRGTGSDAIQDVFHLLAGTNWISLQATWYHDISWWIRWYILIYLDIFQKHSLKIDIWYTLAIDIHWVEIDLHKLSWLCVFKRYRINSIHIKPNAAWCPIFYQFFALLCPDPDICAIWQDDLQSSHIVWPHWDVQNPSTIWYNTGAMTRTDLTNILRSLRMYEIIWDGLRISDILWIWS